MNEREERKKRRGERGDSRRCWESTENKGRVNNWKGQGTVWSESRRNLSRKPSHPFQRFSQSAISTIGKAIKAAWKGEFPMKLRKQGGMLESALEAPLPSSCFSSLILPEGVEEGR